jgi:hypothetical protein
MPAQVHDGPISAAIVRQQVEKILRSGEFGGSELLRNLLSFLTEHSIDRPAVPIKEYELAVAVLGKREGFDPRLDSAVRVHAARLRSKLAEYYMSAGQEDSLLIEVPKGSCHLAWRYRAGEPVLQTIPLKEGPVPAPPPSSGKWFAIGFAAAAVLATASVAIWTATRPDRLPQVVEAFWEPFLKSPQPPVIVFSNHRFTGTSVTGLHHFRDGIDSPTDANDTYSGTGTVMAVAELSSLFSLAGHSSRLKRAELLTWDEARDANIVFVGSPEANSRLGEMALLHHFKFKSGFEEPRYGTGGIINVKPAAGEQSIYFGSSNPYAFDYAVVAMLPNLSPERKILILAGTNTYGCQAAAEFVTSAGMLEDLDKRLGVSKSKKLPDFEALLQVSVSGGVPVKANLVIALEHAPSATAK